MADELRTETPAEGISFEREKLELERERLALERERLDARERELEALQADLEPRSPHELALGPGILAVASAALLLLGAAVGGAVGFDAGRARAPKPRKVLVSRSFLSLMRSIRGIRPVPFDGEEEDAPWMPGRRTEFPETLVLVR